MGRLDGKVAVITGGVSGIGRASVRLFVEEGADVMIGDLQDEKGKRFVEQLGTKAAYIRTDVAKEADIENLIDQAIKKFGRLDCMFNNAGIVGSFCSITDIPADEADAVFRIVFRGALLGMKHAGRIMRHQRSGSIISTASIAGLGAGHGPHVYSAAKAALIHLTRSTAKELGESSVRVNCICPGGIAIPIFGTAFGLATQAADETTDMVKSAFASNQPIPRSGLPGDIANAALFLAGDESSFVNGHSLIVDGGSLGGRGWSESQEKVGKLRALLELRTKSDDASRFD